MLESDIEWNPERLFLRCSLWEVLSRLWNKAWVGMKSMNLPEMAWLATFMVLIDTARLDLVDVPELP
ncbi:hypothetical protein PIB30_001598 [Stylosanthes scabra]|uniref:Uncharacterized protein n=1 Tax=Stylosanthes scabra TaxID=79078 RepID=A0ABU6S2I7_9FABA|nr:hypothetical protein [Stylosanthes scabra]